MTHGERPPAVILAGGLSRRMGEDKAMIRLGNTPLALHVAQGLSPQVDGVFLNAPEDHPLAEFLPLIPDTRPDRPGPLAGVLAALTAFSERDNAPTHVLTTPCDTPFLPHDLVARLLEQSESGTIVMAISAGREHPVTALWPVALADDLDRWLENPDHRRVFDFVARHPARRVEFSLFESPIGPVDPFFNINTPDDLALATTILARGQQ